MKLYDYAGGSPIVNSSVFEKERDWKISSHHLSIALHNLRLRTERYVGQNESYAESRRQLWSVRWSLKKCLTKHYSICECLQREFAQLLSSCAFLNLVIICLSEKKRTISSCSNVEWTYDTSCIIPSLSPISHPSLHSLYVAECSQSRLSTLLALRVAALSYISLRISDGARRRIQM